jgi:ubiquinone/menaquinone biosynthesis C-methylase UbiE
MNSDISGFANVDRTQAPGSFVSYLDQASNLAYMKTVQREMIDRLSLAPGAKVLDVGCGPGDRVLELQALVQPDGCAFGVDLSETMISEARKRAAAHGAAAVFETGDACRLPFPDDELDGCQAERIFVHLEDPATALREMVRVTKPGGRVVVFEMDAETLIVDAPDRSVTRSVLHLLVDSFRSQGWVGRRLRGLFQEMGLRDLTITPHTLVLTDFSFADGFWGLERTADRARDAGVITAEQAEQWVASLRAMARRGAFFNSVTAFLVAGTK